MLELFSTMVMRLVAWRQNRSARRPQRSVYSGRLTRPWVAKRRASPRVSRPAALDRSMIGRSSPGGVLRWLLGGIGMVHRIACGPRLRKVGVGGRLQQSLQQQGRTQRRQHAERGGDRVAQQVEDAADGALAVESVEGAPLAAEDRLRTRLNSS